MIDTVELGRSMMANAATLDDDSEFNQWARLGPMLIEMGSRSPVDGIKLLSPEEQQVVARAMLRLDHKSARVA